MGSVLHTKLPKIAFKFKVQFISNGIKLYIAALAYTDTLDVCVCWRWSWNRTHFWVADTVVFR